MKKEFATSRKINTLKEALDKADVFIGLSVQDILTRRCLKVWLGIQSFLPWPTPIPKLIITWLLNPYRYHYGYRSFRPSQSGKQRIGFSLHFRGALDVRATKINEEMKSSGISFSCFGQRERSRASQYCLW